MLPKEASIGWLTGTVIGAVILIVISPMIEKSPLAIGAAFIFGMICGGIGAFMGLRFRP